MEALILVGGLGTRLREYVIDTPKPLAKIAGRPFLMWVLDFLSRQGISRVVLAAGYMSEKIENTIGHSWGSITVDYVFEEELLGTGGAIKNALKHIKNNSFFILNGDTWLNLNYSVFMNEVIESNCEVGVAITQVKNSKRYGQIKLENQHITLFFEKNGNLPGYINGGVYFIKNKEKLIFPSTSVFSFEKDMLFLLAKKKMVFGFTKTNNFIDIGVPEDYIRAEKESKNWI
jgi:D-glycero-alpha-D-manno-heptose 1-phosphate guanylyltransferase